jgi:hypothetical protein
MISQTQDKLKRLIDDADGWNFEKVFEYVDLLVARERAKIFHDFNKVAHKFHWGCTQKKRYDGSVSKTYERINA